jgi:rubrerythrin
VTISDNLTPRERQIRETLAGIRGAPPDEDAADSHEFEMPEPPPVLDDAARERRLAQAERERTQWWWCPRCRTRVQGSGSICPTCHPEAA